MATKARSRPARSGAGFFKVIRFDRTIRGSEQALRYVAFRSRDLEKGRSIFDDRSDHADVKRFVKNLPERVTRHPHAAKAYHCLFSARRTDWDRAGMTDWKDTVREVMRQYEVETKRRLEWVASEHKNEDHPHCHVIIKAAYTDRNGVKRQLRLNRTEVQRIKEITGRVMQARGLAPVRQLPRQDLGRFIGSVGSALDWLRRHIQASRRRELEEERRRRLEEEEERERYGR